MQDHFEVKLKGRLGTEDKDEKHMRVLNRILTATAEGLHMSRILGMPNFWFAIWVFIFMTNLQRFPATILNTTKRSTCNQSSSMTPSRTSLHPFAMPNAAA